MHLSHVKIVNRFEKNLNKSTKQKKTQKVLKSSITCPIAL